MELTKDEKQITINILSNVSVPVKESTIVMAIITKLQAQMTKPAENTPEEQPAA